jgi:signal transduction histidine kinase
MSRTFSTKNGSADSLRGLGLVGMGERVEHLGGTFQVKSELGRGTELEVALPLFPRTLEDTSRDGSGV